MPRALQIDVYEYLDYREFLKDAYADLKARKRGFSYRWFSRRCGMSSPNFLKLVIEGARNLSASAAVRFAEALGLNVEEATFFQTLVAFNQASSAAERSQQFARLGKFHKHRSVRKIDHSMFEYLSNWYYPVIRELVACKGFQEDASWIARRLRARVTPAQVRKAIEVLLKIGVVERDQEGKLRQSSSLLSTGPEARDLAVGNFHRQMIERALDAIETVERSEREISGMTLALTADGFKAFKAKIQELRAELLALSDRESDPTRIVQFNFQAFPLADVEENKS